MAGSGWDPAGVEAEIAISGDGQTATRTGDETFGTVRGIEGRSKGRRYFEISPGDAPDDSFCSGGFVGAGASLDVDLGTGMPIAGGWKPASGTFSYSYPGGSGTRENQPDVSAGVLGILIDFDEKTCTVYRDGAIDWVEPMDIPNDTVLYPAASLYSDTTMTLQTVEPFQFPPAVTFIAWDKPDSALGSRVAGLMEIEGVPVERMLRAFSFERLTFVLDDQTITESKPLGQTVSDPGTGEYEIILRDGFPREVFVVAFDDYGQEFEADVAIVVGDRIHPTAPNGYVYDCVTAGSLPSVEPTWSTDTGQDQAVGTAEFRPALFYRPAVHGPISPEIIEIGLDIQVMRKTIAMGADFTACVKPDGTVAAWGNNQYGTTDVPAGLTDVVAVACSYYDVFALKSDGTVVGWGRGLNGSQNIPAGLSEVIGISPTGYGCVALKDDGTVVTWGNTSGSTGATDIAQVASGYDHGIALDSEGAVVTWGDTGNGKRNVPTGLNIATIVSAGMEHSLALSSDGTVYAWGLNGSGQCNVPAGLGGVKDLAGGRFHSAALIDTGEVVMWGTASYGLQSPPEGLGDVVMISSFYYTMAAVQSDGNIVMWGDNDEGVADVPAGVTAKV